jgi:hypothetical protein
MHDAARNSYASPTPDLDARALQLGSTMVQTLAGWTKWHYPAPFQHYDSTGGSSRMRWSKGTTRISFPSFLKSSLSTTPAWS